jgi:hypothetical protein
MKIIEKEIGELTAYENNSRTHSDEQIGQMVASINEFGFTNPILINPNNRIIAGHGRVMAAKEMEMDKVPCVILDGLTEAQEKAYVIADNQIALNAGWDQAMLQLEVADLKEFDFDLDLLAFESFDFDGSLEKEEDIVEAAYSRKIVAPIYEPSEDKPSFDEMYELGKYTELVDEINNSQAVGDEKDFLLLAATRHIVFKYDKIAEFYAHSDNDIKVMMQKSALIIIDFNAAIEYGFVKMAGDLLELADSE